MKLNINHSLSLSLISLILSTVISAEQLETTYHNDMGFKNVAFVSCIGGASHYNWVLSIIDELAERGHNTTFLTSEKDARFGKPYKLVNTVPLCATIDYDPKKILNSDVLRKKSMAEFFVIASDTMQSTYEKDYFSTKNYFIANNIDLALCDHFSDACVDAATSVGIPYIITTALEFTKESAAPYIHNNFFSLNRPTTEFETLFERFKLEFITPFKSLRTLYPVISKLVDRKRAIGVDAKMEDPSETWKNSLKLVNNAHGFSPARPIGPLAELIGPIIPKQYTPLNEPLKQYLDGHERVVYIAFGQMATPSEKDTQSILVALLESIEHGYIDGFLWATVNSGGLFPDTVTTSSGNIYTTADMFNQTHPHARMVSWAPQTAVLLHPSVSLFVSHGGLGSWYEAMFAGKRMLMFPFFGDQPVNSHTIQDSNLGKILHYDARSTDIAKTIDDIVSDKDGKFRDSVKRMQAYTQIRSMHGVVRGADVVEEVAYTHKDGLLNHRITADRRMSYMKAHNLDIYGLLVLIIVSGLSIIGFILFKLKQLLTMKPKIKTH